MAGSTVPAEDPLSAEASEVRRLVEAGASSPEELRALAARLRDLREQEEARWRSEVKPALLKEKKGRLRPGQAIPPPAVAPITSPPEGASPSWPTALPDPDLAQQPITPAQPRSLWIGGGMLVLVGLALIAVNTTVWVLILPAVGLLVWAWVQGQRSDEA